MGEFLHFGGQKCAQGEIEIFRHIRNDFLKKDHKSSFHTKNYENLMRHMEDRGSKHNFLTKSFFFRVQNTPGG